jgi:HPt (histidine-containing phosphotransfer) domain-containing protein
MMDVREPDSTGGGDQPALDLETLADLDEFGSEFVADLVQAFADQSVELLVAIEAGLSAVDADAVRRAAHTFKGGAASIGATSVSAAGAALEQLAKSGVVDGAEPFVGILKLAVARDIAALRRHVSEMVG